MRRETAVYLLVSLLVILLLLGFFYTQQQAYEQGMRDIDAHLDTEVFLELNLTP